MLSKYVLNPVDTVFYLIKSGTVLHVDQHEMEVNTAVDTHKSVFGVCCKSAATPLSPLSTIKTK